MDPSIDKAEEFLKSLGFECEREPSWVTEGRKPDLYCQGLVSMWVEVKNLEETPGDIRIYDLGRNLSNRTQGISAPWSAYAYISEEATERDIRIVVELARRLFEELEHTHDKYDQALVMIPNEPVYGKSIRFSVETEDGTVTVFSCESKAGRYGFPFTFEPLSYNESVSITYRDGCQEVMPLFKLVGSEDPLVALELTPGSDRFELEGWGRSTGAIRLRNIDRLRNRVRTANAQLRNGMSYREAPSLLLVYQDHVLVPADIAVVAALYGDLTYTFHREDPDAGYSSYNLNGVFGPEKNTSVSALCIVRNNAIPFTVHNQWAKLPLPQGLLGGREVIPKDDGSFEFVDY